MPNNQSKPIFVSHAAVDKAIADKVVDLLNTAMGVDVQKDVFCASLEGMKIPPGIDFKQFIKEQIQEPKIVILLISQNYLVSQFCLAEVGASWAMSHRIIPMLIPPARYEDMKAVLVNTQALNIEDPNDWNEALAVFKEIMEIDPNTNRWERKRDEHLEAIKMLVTKQEPLPIVPLSKFSACEAKLKAANEEIAGLEKEVARLNLVVDKLKEAKDATAAAQIELDSMPEKKKFEELVNTARKRMKPLLPVVRMVLYYYFRGEHLLWDAFSKRKITEAIESGYLEDCGSEGVKINENDPKIERAVADLKILETFIEKVSYPFFTAYKDQYDEIPSFESRRFWERHHLL